MKNFNIYVVVLLITFGFDTAHSAPPIYADGDVGPLGTPDGLIDSADHHIASRILTGRVTPTELEYSHGDVYPVGAPMA